MADTYTWVGKALEVAQVDTITIADAWNTGDTCTVTIGQKDLILTIGTDDTTANIATAVKEMINGDTQTGTGDHTFSETGDNVPEFREVTATVSGSVVTVTGDTAGKPFTMTTGRVVVGDGTAERAASTACTGSHWASNADNWYNITNSVYEAPADAGDAEAGVLVFEEGDTDCLYGLNALTAVSPASLIIKASYNGNIGLPRVNEDDPSYPYPEYRGTYFEIGAVADAQTITCKIGEGSGNGSQRLNLDFGDCQMITTVHKSGSRPVSGVPSILIKGTHASNTVSVLRGDVGINYFTVATANNSVVATLRIGYITNPTSDSTVYVGSGTTITNVHQYGGTMTIDAATTDMNCLGGTCTVLSSAHTAIEATDATVYYQSSGTVTTALVNSGGTIDCSRSTSTPTFTNTTVNKGGSILDPYKLVTFTNAIATTGKLADITLSLGMNRSYQVS